MLEQFGITSTVMNFVAAAEKDAATQFERFRKIGEYNSCKVLSAFNKCQVSDRHFSPTTGYGYSDQGREKLSELFAEAFGAEDALVSPLIASGTHALTIALFAILRPLDSFLCVTGRPYDTILPVIGLQGRATGSLKDFAIGYEDVELTASYDINYDLVRAHLLTNPKVKMVYIQRARGYSQRPALSIGKIGAFIDKLRTDFPQIPVVVDNCYGEFTEKLEPTEVGADLIVGSLIKNPGGGIAPTGAYIAGKREYVEAARERLTVPGIGGEIGSYAASYRLFFQGFCLSPHVVCQSLMGACLAAVVFERLGFEVFPRYEDPRSDITQSIRFSTEEDLVTYIRAVQKASPVDSHVVPHPWSMPGYQDKVIMAAGTFVQGSSVELSADAPIREPFLAHMQGGLTYENIKLAVMMAITDMGLLDR